MEKTERDYVRAKPKPTEDEALTFARSVMVEKGCDVDWGPYQHKDGFSCKGAAKALEAHAVDMSERMALEMCLYAIEPAAA